jgi:hypothetical protein
MKELMEQLVCFQETAELWWLFAWLQNIDIEHSFIIRLVERKLHANLQFIVFVRQYNKNVALG